LSEGGGVPIRVGGRAGDVARVGSFMGQQVLRMMCPNLKCRAVLGVPVSSRGKLVRCRSCGTSVKVPQAKSAAGEGGAAGVAGEPGAESGGASEAA